MLATSEDAILLKRRGFNLRVVTWRALFISSWAEAFDAAKFAKLKRHYMAWADT